MRIYPLMSKGYNKEQKHQNPRDNERGLFEIADAQQGFFTAKQAVTAGYSEKNHAFHVHAGNWVRELHGVYRLRSYPQSHESDLVLWSLWSRGKDGVPQGIYSHETVLSHYDLSDLNPARLHMTVPTRFKRMAKPPENLVLYKSDIPKEEIRQLHGYQMTTVKRALEDMIQGEAYPKGLIESAVVEALKSGQLTVSEFENSQILKPFQKLLQSRKQLAFAGIPAISYPTLSKEQQFAEKIHAYTLPRDPNRSNSRVKDLVDLMLLIQSSELDQLRIREALDATFKRRKTHSLPAEFPDPPIGWEKPFQNLAKEVGLDEDLVAGVGIVKLFFKKL